MQSAPDQESNFVASYLSWARESRAYATLMPLFTYRGYADKDWKLLPTLCRQGYSPEILKGYEKEIIDEFRSRFSLVDWQDIEVLAYARHCGAPTRLLDWSRNPLVGLWFSVSDPAHDEMDGAVFQLDLTQGDSIACLATGFQLSFAEECKCGRPVHIFSCPARIDRASRQQSVFSITTLKDDLFLKPLNELDKSGPSIRTFPVSASLKAPVRRLLSAVGLDAFSLYGDPDSFGKSLTVQFDISDVRKRQ